jgi:gas vesicle protein
MMPGRIREFAIAKGVMVMKEETAKRGGSLMMPALMGGAVGAGIALLLAPRSGEQMRKDLKRFAAETRGQVGDVIDEGMDLYKKGRKAVAKAVKAGMETIDEGTDKIAKLVKKNGRPLLIPTLATGIIGAGAALLLIPRSGTERVIEGERH